MARKVLDVCCGPKMMWFQKDSDETVYCDIRKVSVTVKDTSNGRPNGQRVVSVEPDIVCSYVDLPFKNDQFDLVVFDPSHLVKVGNGSWLKVKYGKLEEGWQLDIKRGFEECFRVLKSSGTLIFKWSETQVTLGNVLKLTDRAPIFGNKQPKSCGTHWIVF